MKLCNDGLVSTSIYTHHTPNNALECLIETSDYENESKNYSDCSSKETQEEEEVKIPTPRVNLEHQMKKK